MNVRVISTGLFAIILAFCGTQTEAQEDVLLDLDRSLSKALLAGDIDALDASIAEDYRSVGIDGQITGKSESIAWAKTDARKSVEVELSELSVKPLGTVAIVYGISTWYQKSAEGRELIGRYRYTDTYAFRDSRWELVASQGTPMSTEQGQQP